MSKIVYQVVRHEDGWAYRADGVYSEAYSSHDAALGAALRAAAEQRVSGADTAISWEDAQGRWHEELASGRDRPDTEVRG